MLDSNKRLSGVERFNIRPVTTASILLSASIGASTLSHVVFACVHLCTTYYSAIQISVLSSQTFPSRPQPRGGAANNKFMQHIGCMHSYKLADCATSCPTHDSRMAATRANLFVVHHHTCARCFVHAVTEQHPSTVIRRGQPSKHRLHISERVPWRSISRLSTLHFVTATLTHRSATYHHKHSTLRLPLVTKLTTCLCFIETRMPVLQSPAHHTWAGREQCLTHGLHHL